MSNSKAGIKRCRKTLQQLNDLCDELIDRDIQIKKDIQLFEEVFKNFPVPVSIWSVSSENVILSSRGDAIEFGAAKEIEELALGAVTKEKFLKEHAQAMVGNATSFLAQDGTKVMWVKIVPRYGPSDNIAGVMGIAWDVTSSAVMLSSLENIASIISKDIDTDAISKEVDAGLKASQLKKLFDARGKY